ncbi:hypothetical protein CCACVL1_04561 [Corchorus capsularis]|uniref:Uncharacterized protein n=1 Tax=Corchorus capsularis TaxID=210143 RepID=A0A1R3JRN7_COCAP|nr:hypothetical protein CCACVL1_04561 [Corchorus capsularis]
MVLEASAATGGNSHLTVKALNPAQAASCDRNTGKSCAPPPNSGRKVPPNCAPVSYNRDCHRFNNDGSPLRLSLAMMAPSPPPSFISNGIVNYNFLLRIRILRLTACRQHLSFSPSSL